jgi:heme-degrading monooxygenase HmoA
MILRIWRTALDPSRREAYAQFERDRSLPMFRAQPGLLGVLFLREGADRAAALTMWRDLAAVEALRHSPTYQDTSAVLQTSGLLTDKQTVELFEIRGGDLVPGLVAAIQESTVE